MCTVYLRNTTVICVLVDGSMIGEVLKDRVTAILTYKYLCVELDDENKLSPESCILN